MKFYGKFSQVSQKGNNIRVKEHILIMLIYQLKYRKKRD